MARIAWPEVTKDRPCPICRKDHRCKLAADGKAARCFRLSEAPSGWKKTRVHQSGGGTFFVDNGKPARGPRKSKAKPSPDIPQNPPATNPSEDASLLHRAYTALLSHFTLDDAHRQQLRQRGLRDEQIEEAGYRSKPGVMCLRPCESVLDSFGAPALIVPGITKSGRPGMQSEAGLLIPVRNIGGEIIALKLRLDQPRGKAKYIWISSRTKSNPDGPSPGSPAHVPLFVTASSIAAAGGRCRLTEGELKADIAWRLSALPTISFPGASQWPVALEAAQTLGATTIRLAFDMDCRANKDVARQLLLAVQRLHDLDLSWELEIWDASQKGIDDALQAERPIEVLTGEAANAALKAIAKAAGIDPRSAGERVLGRLEQVLDGGAQRLYADRDLLNEIAQLSVADPPAFAAAYSLIRDADVPMRKFDHAIKPAIERAIREHPPVLARGEDGGFFEDGGCICRTKYTPHGPKTVSLCNFTAAIVDETVHDDGIERRTFLGVTGRMFDGRPLPRTEIAAAAFSRMEWVVQAWGSGAIIWPAEAKALPAAIQALSKDIKRRTVYSHTGWRKIGNSWAYLHSGGTIAADGADLGEVTVSLAPPLDRYILPEPPTGQGLIEAVRCSLRLLEMAPDRIMFPVLGAVYRAPLGPCGLSVSLIGRTGAGKTELAALAQQHFGKEMNASNLPASWTSTANSLDLFAFLAKDAILVVDDFNPGGSGQDVSRAHRDGDRFFRSQGNGSGRSRMRPDGSLQPEKPHRCLAISTGEDLIRTHSGRARQWLIEVSEADGIIERLTPFQQAAAAGELAAAVAGYLRWLAAQLDTVHSNMPAQINEYRQLAAGGNDHHARVPTMVAELTLGFRMFLQFAREVGAITTVEETSFRDRGWRALIEGSADQDGHHRAANPVLTFLRLVAALLSSGRAHLANLDGTVPAIAPAAWGWRTAGNGSQPCGLLIGWVDGDEVFLEGDSVFAEVQKLAQSQGDSLSIGPTTLFKRLREQGHLVETDENRQTLKVRRVIAGRRREVLHLRAESLFPTLQNPTNPTTSDVRHAVDGASDGRESPAKDAPASAPTIVKRDGTMTNDTLVGLVGSAEPIDRELGAWRFDEGTI